MTIKLEKETRRLKTMICLSGRLQAKHLEELKTQLEGAGRGLRWISTE